MEKVFESALTEAEQYVRECEEFVLKQAALVEKLEKEDCPAAAEDAREALVSLKKGRAEANSRHRVYSGSGGAVGS